MLRFTPLLALLASPAAAHGTGLPHIHASDAAIWLALGTAFVGVALLVRAKAKPKADKRDRT